VTFLSWVGGANRQLTPIFLAFLWGLGSLELLYRKKTIKVGYYYLYRILQIDKKPIAILR